MKWGATYPEARHRCSQRLLATVGEPITPEAWVWYWQHIGGGRCPVVDPWWQTETGAILISPLPGATVLKPGSATFPLPGIDAEVVDDKGEVVKRGGGHPTPTPPRPPTPRGAHAAPEPSPHADWSRLEGPHPRE